MKKCCIPSFALGVSMTLLLCSFVLAGGHESTIEKGKPVDKTVVAKRAENNNSLSKIEKYYIEAEHATKEAYLKALEKYTVIKTEATKKVLEWKKEGSEKIEKIKKEYFEDDVNESDNKKKEKKVRMIDIKGMDTVTKKVPSETLEKEEGWAEKVKSGWKSLWGDKKDD